MTTRDEVIKAAREADCAIHDVEELERLYALAFKAGMERAAGICSEVGQKPSSLWGESGCWTHSAQVCAETVCEEVKK